MPDSEQLLDDLAGAVLDGAAVDWAAAESSADATARRIVGHLRLVSSVAELHRNLLPAEDVPSLPSQHNRTATPDRWGHLRLLERIGRGAFGEVFHAWDTRLDREVALKLLPAASSSDSEAESSIIREGRLLAKVRHPNVVTIYGAEQIGDRIGLWMEFVRGHTLEQILDQRKVVSAPEAVAIGLELCRAMSAVHAAGLLHRDIKAHNVMRAEDGRILLMDFGTGRELHDDAASDLAGTPLYLAPEVLQGQHATVRSDIYSLGVLLYHLVTGAYPVQARTVREVRRAHGRGERTAVQTARSDVPSKLARVIERAIDPRPERRCGSADALGAELAALKPRPRIVRLAHAAGVAGAVLLVALLAVEIRARLTGDDRNFGSRLVSWIAGAPSPIEHPAIAVLPFKNVASEPGSDLLVDSVTAGLIRQLAIIDGLQVRSQTSSFMLKDKPRDLADFSKRLGVNLVVEGDAALSGGTLLVHAALVSVKDGVPLWSDTIERRIGSEGDVGGVVEDLTRTIVNRLRLKLGRTQRRYDTDIATFQTYLRARALRDTRGQEVRAAVPLFEEVIRKDPSFAPAKAALAATYGYMGFYYPDPDNLWIPPRDATALMGPLTQQALEIDPTLAEAHAAMGFIHAFALRWVDAEKSFRRAIELDPSLTTAYGDFVLSTLIPWGRLDDALRTLETALQVDPLSLDMRIVMAGVQGSAGLYADALDNYRRVLDVDPNLPDFVRLFRAWALFFNGDRAAALDWFEEFSDGGRREGVKGWIHAINGRRKEAEDIAARFSHIPSRQAEIYGLLGDKDRALEALERLAVMNPMLAGFQLVQPAVGLRDDPRAEAFRRKLGFPR